MLDEFDNKLLIERLKRRIEQANTYFLMKIGSYIKQIKSLNPSKAQQLIQMLKYGGNFEEIIKKLAEYTGMNVADINDIFYNYAKKDQYFYEKFYEYRNVPFIPFDQNSALKMQTRALSNIAANEMYDFTRANVLGYTINNKFYNLRDTYNELLDTAFLNVGQGKETFDSAMKHILEDIGGSGLKTINYASGRAVRLDSVIEMHLNSRLRELHNENQKIIGEEFGADGVEISVHLNPAPDHELAQGRQFSNEEFEKLNNGQDAIDYKGRTITLDHDHKNGYRPISEMNCYHYVFSIVLGVSEPNYTDKELKQIIDNNNKGFEFEGKHYTNYEGTQIQRRLEREVRKQKDIQILARESDNQELIASSQDNITKLTRKYKEFSKQSGLTPYMENMKVSGYKRVKINLSKENKFDISKLKENEVFVSKEENERINEFFIKDYEQRLEKKDWIRDFEKEIYQYRLEERKKGYKDEIIQLNNIDDCNRLLKKINTKIYGDEIKNSDFRLVREATQELYKNSIKSPAIMKDLTMNVAGLKAEKGLYEVANTRASTITLNNDYFKDYEKFKEMAADYSEPHKYVGGEMHSWWSEVAKENQTKEIIVHEFGHRLHWQVYHDSKNSIGTKAYDYFLKKYGETRYSALFKKEIKEIPTDKWDTIKRDLIYEPIRRLQTKTGLTQKEIINKYVSMYGRKTYEEMFAETFANSQLGKSNALGDEFIRFLQEIGEWEQ